ncbi:NAD(P)-dependent oxidoreductase [Hymenobacter wooponensis]|uniref:NAD-dependent epimerase/dehydratase family protein n=1 Tax=Hymenobacter wooponensis TaxID=1525360 RepID=A0A4Z0MF28_9BACT|nr:NAD(P)-binding oxidoreductase [Hymenobacter wooponensis]TGD77835.1 NAD-dependent epimerase/dehydratase family protein [Hymenobacter wooponensis]
MKRILVYGATGRTGGLVVAYALQQGYAVTALVRNPAKISLASPYLTVVRGQPTNLADIRRAMQGCDFVISTLSALSEAESFSLKKITPPHTLETSMGYTIQAMRELGLQRIVTLSSIGVGDSWPYAPWYMRLMIRLTNFKLVFADHDRQETLLRQSGLEWVIARPVALNNREQIGQLIVRYQQTPSPFAISRQQLARFMVDCLQGDDFLHKAPLLAEK